MSTARLSITVDVFKDRVRGIAIAYKGFPETQRKYVLKLMRETLDSMGFEEGVKLIDAEIPAP